MFSKFLCSKSLIIILKVTSYPSSAGTNFLQFGHSRFFWSGLLPPITWFEEKFARFVGVPMSVPICKAFFYFNLIFLCKGGFLTLSLGRSDSLRRSPEHQRNHNCPFLSHLKLSTILSTTLSSNVRLEM